MILLFAWIVIHVINNLDQKHKQCLKYTHSTVSRSFFFPSCSFSLFFSPAVLLVSCQFFPFCKSLQWWLGYWSFVHVSIFLQFLVNYFFTWLQYKQYFNRLSIYLFVWLENSLYNSNLCLCYGSYMQPTIFSSISAVFSSLSHFPLEIVSSTEIQDKWAIVLHLKIMSEASAALLCLEAMCSTWHTAL